MTKCFLNDCTKEVNHRGKFCEFHDKIERDLATQFEKKIDGASGDLSRDELKRFQMRVVK
jgi:hypothetical protein